MVGGIVACKACSLFRRNRCGLLGETGELKSCLVINMAASGFSLRHNGVGAYGGIVRHVRSMGTANLTSRVIVRRCHKRGVSSVRGCKVSVFTVNSS